jgi:hypothetical protein
MSTLHFLNQHLTNKKSIYEKIFTTQAWGLSRMQWPPSKWCQKVTLVVFSVMSCLLFSLGASAQVKVTGTVTDTTGEALTGVAVRIKGARAVQQPM